MYVGCRVVMVFVLAAWPSSAFSRIEAAQSLFDSDSDSALGYVFGSLSRVGDLKSKAESFMISDLADPASNQVVAKSDPADEAEIKSADKSDKTELSKTEAKDVQPHGGGLGGIGSPANETTADVESDGKTPEEAPQGPSPMLVAVADLSNLLAGLTLVVAFVSCLLTFHLGVVSMEASASLIKLTLFAEGALYCIAGMAMSVINLTTQGFGSAMLSQMIITCGGIFFALSAFGSPIFIVSAKCVINPLSFFHVCPHCGITCFMIGTGMGLCSVSALPKDTLVSPFWGVACFFLGAWTIGLFHLWIPTLAGGSNSFDGLKDDELQTVLDVSPSYTWTWKLWFAVLGAVFLTSGAFIFCRLDAII